MYEKRKSDFRRLLTPEGLALSPKGKFSNFKDHLKDINVFASLDEKAVRRTAVDLNRLMRTVADIPKPKQVTKELAEIADLTGKLVLAIEGLNGVSLSALTKTYELFPPYLPRPRGSSAEALPRNRDDERYRTAFAPELRILDAINERPFSASHDTNDPEQIALLNAYEKAKSERDARRTAECYIPWRGPPVRETCVEPFVSRLVAFKQLAESGAAGFGKGGAGRLASVAIKSWENAYAKICWTFVREQCGDAVACNLKAGEERSFLKLIRAIAEYASGKNVEIRLWRFREARNRLGQGDCRQ